MLTLLAVLPALVAAAPSAPVQPLIQEFHRPDVSSWAPTPCGVNNQITSYGKQLDPAAVLQEYPRPQLTRPPSTYTNLNGLWDFANSSSPTPPTTFSDSILVPFPAEACLSGLGTTYKTLWYRTQWTASQAALDHAAAGGRVLLHFGAVDWQATVYVNGAVVGNHTGGYDGFSFDVTPHLGASNTLHVYVFDPSDDGYQPNGKQRISAITNPGGDTYTPASGIWQTVWLEAVPATHVSAIKLVPTMTSITVSVATNTADSVKYAVVDATGAVVATASGATASPVTITVPSPHLWDVDTPYLYGLNITLASGDAVQSYFGLRTSGLVQRQTTPQPGTGVQLGDRPGADLPGYPVVIANDSSVCWGMCNATAACTHWAFCPSGPCNSAGGRAQCWLKHGPPGPVQPKPCRYTGTKGFNGTYSRPVVNGKFTFRAGWLDQSFWPDGIYTAPTDAGLAFDLQAVKTFGLNTVRLHQKVNPERWYWYADTLGLYVLQDAVQKYGHATPETVAPFIHDLTAMMTGPVANHPSVIQWETFNEGDCYDQFNVSSVVDLAARLDPTRPIDTDSGGPANDLYIGQVNDVHTYADPRPSMPSASQYAMIGEFGGIGGGWVDAHTWVPGQCHTYLKVDTVQDTADAYVGMAHTIGNATLLSCSIYTQITDVELECDGFVNYDRSPKFNADQLAAIKASNEAIVKALSDP